MNLLVKEFWLTEKHKLWDQRFSKAADGRSNFVQFKRLKKLKSKETKGIYALWLFNQYFVLSTSI